MVDRKVFVAYPYSFPADDYRRVYGEVAHAHGSVRFVYADERITNLSMLRKIQGMIEDAEFGIFDITTWNPNVTLELGIAVGANLDYYIAFNPTFGHKSAVPSDLGGIDRLQYESHGQLGKKVTQLLAQRAETAAEVNKIESRAQRPAASAPTPAPPGAPSINMRLTLLNAWRIGKELSRTPHLPHAESQWASEVVKHLMTGDHRDLERFIAETKLGDQLRVLKEIAEDYPTPDG